MPIRRLDQFLAVRNFGTRKDVTALIKAGKVLVNGARALHGGQKIDIERDAVTVGGAAVPMQEFVYIMLHKPRGVISAARDPKTPTVLDLLPEHLRRRGLFPVGRLDKNTTGLLLITDNGALAHMLLSPKKHVAKTYLVTLQKEARPEDIAAFAAGMHLPPADGHSPEDCLPAQLELLPGRQARVTLHEGKYHQIKRMFAYTGNAVLELHRETFGGLALDETLQPGECRELTEAETAFLMQK